MEVKVITHEKEMLTLEIDGEGHTFSNLLREELTNDKTVKKVGYRMENTLINKIIFVLEAKDPVKSLNEACERLRKNNKDYIAAFKKAL